MGLVELLVALGISAALLTSVAVATDAAFKAYAANQSQAQLTQRARLAMNRIVTYIRSSDTHAPENDGPYNTFKSKHVAQDSGIEMMLDLTNGITFRQTGNRLEMVPFTMSVAGVQTYGTARTLLDGVGTGDFVVRFQPLMSSKVLKLERASIVLTVRPTSKTTVKGEQVAGDSVTLSTSVMPRKNIW
jgi:type II secretory pathway component PulJ